MRLRTSRTRSRQGLAVVLVLVAMAVVALIATSTLSLTSTDRSSSIQSMRHSVLQSTAFAGVENARAQLATVLPSDNLLVEALGTYYIDETSAKDLTPTTKGVPSEGTWRVESIFQKCGGAPAGFSAEVGSNAFRTDFWMLRSTSRLSTTTVQEGPTASAATIVSKLRRGSCHIR